MINFWKYLKERWLTYLFLIVAFLFASLVYKLDGRFNISPSNASYICIGWLMLLVIFISVDYTVFRYRIATLDDYCQFNSLEEPSGKFAYPLDNHYAMLFYNLKAEHEQYKSMIRQNSAEQLEFITKWLHDVKVPIAATRLVLDQHESQVDPRFYQSIDQELFTIEKAIEKVFYQIKAGSLYEDYKISKIQTQNLIAAALKPYSNIFGYKELKINLTGSSYEVLTDEKWSEYILSQLISNAVKYTPQGGQIEISTKLSDNSVTISVKNSGQGIPSQDICQIFKRGYTSSDNRSGSKATGYGLYLAKKVAEKLGHRLSVDSKLGQYAMFSLTFSQEPTLYQVTKL